MAKTEAVRRQDLYRATGGTGVMAPGGVVVSTAQTALSLEGDDGELAVAQSQVIVVAGGTGLVTSTSGHTLTIELNIGTGLAASGDDLVHDTGDLGDLHTNYAEHDAAETISASWLWGTNKKAQFRDAAIYVHSSADGQLDAVADVAVVLTAPTVQIAASTRTYISAGPLDLNGNLEFQGAKSITSTSGDVTLAPAGDVLFNPTGAQVRLLSGVTLQSNDYASQTTGWGISYEGGGDFRYLFADELHAKAFICDLEQALAGGQIIGKSVAVLSRAFTAPAAGAAATLYVWDLPSAENMAVFEAGDVVCLREFSRAAGSLTISFCWGTVSNYANLADKEQSWTFTRSAAPNAGAMAAGTVVAGEAVVLDWGTDGNGVYEVNAVDGAYGVNSPYWQIVTWSGHPHSGKTVRARGGNLHGVTGVTEYGLFAGAGVAAGDAHIRLSDQNVEIHNVPMAFYDSGNVQRVGIDPGAGATEALLWAGPDSGNPSFQVFGDGTVWMSMAAISAEAGALLFSQASGLLLLGPYAPISATSWTSTRGQIATLSGAFHQEAGRATGTPGLVVEEGTTNYMANPVFAGNITDGWTVTGGGSGSAQTSNYLFEGRSFKLTAGATATVAQSNTVSVPNGASITCSAYLYRVANKNASVVVRDTTNNVGRATGTPSTVGEWERVTATWTNTTGGAVNVATRVNNLETDSASILLFDGAQMELKAYATSLCYGSRGAGYAWDTPASPHNSSSTRTATAVSLDAHTGTVNARSAWSCRLVAQMPYSATATWPAATLNFLWDVRGADNSNRVYVAYDATNDCFVLASNGTALCASAGQTFAAGDWIELVVTLNYADDVYCLYTNGVAATPGTTALSAPVLTNWRVGSAYNNSLCANVTVWEYAVFGVDLTAEQAVTMYAAARPLTDAGNMRAPWLSVLDGGFTIASSTSGTRLEMDSSRLAIGAGIVYGGVGAWLGLDAGTPKFSVYADANNYLKWDGANLSWKGAKSALSTAGEITATGGAIGGWTLSASTLANGTNIILDSSNKAISINSATYGQAGIQLQYNAGSPRAHVGNGTTEYFKYDGSALDIMTGGGQLRFNNYGFQFNAGGQFTDGGGASIGVVWFEDTFGAGNDELGRIRAVIAANPTNPVFEIVSGGATLGYWENMRLATQSSSGTRTHFDIDAVNKQICVYGSSGATVAVRNNGDGDWPALYAQQVSNNRAAAHFDQDHASAPIVRLDGPTAGAAGALAGYAKINVNGTDRYLPYYATS